MLSLFVPHHQPAERIVVVKVHVLQAGEEWRGEEGRSGGERRGGVEERGGEGRGGRSGGVEGFLC